MDDCLPLDQLQAALPLWDWFSHLREAGLVLTIDQYHDFCQCVWQGRVLTWQDLRSVSAILWVKSGADSQQRQIFDRAFAKYRQLFIPEPEQPPEKAIAQISTASESDKKLVDSRLSTKPQPPPLPQRIGGDQQIAAAVSLPSKNSASHPHYSGPWRWSLEHLPMSIRDIRGSYEVLSPLLAHSLADQLDGQRTAARTGPTGITEKLVYRKRSGMLADLLMLVDDSENMLTYWPAFDQLFTAIEDGTVSPVRRYRFSGYPGRYFYEWESPYSRIAVEQELTHVSDRSILVIISDGGAAIGLPDPERVQGMIDFLGQWQQRTIWLNPVPPERWAGTPAAEIQAALGYPMISFSQFNGQGMRNLLVTREWSV